MPPIIKVENLSKRYVIGHDRGSGGMFRYDSFRDTIAHPQSPIIDK